MAKMRTVKQIAVGKLRRRGRQEARIERNIFECNGEVFEALRFCKNKNGRHVRVHLVVREGEFVELFRDAVEHKVFAKKTLLRLLSVLEQTQPQKGAPSADPDADPFLAVIGICEDGHLTEGIDEELYGDKSW